MWHGCSVNRLWQGSNRKSDKNGAHGYTPDVFAFCCLTMTVIPFQCAIISGLTHLLSMTNTRHRNNSRFIGVKFSKTVLIEFILCFSASWDQHFLGSSEWIFTMPWPLHLWLCGFEKGLPAVVPHDLPVSAALSQSNRKTACCEICPFQFSY